MNDDDHKRFMHRHFEQQRRQQLQSYIQCGEARQTDKWLALLELPGDKVIEHTCVLECASQRGKYRSKRSN
jgi:hypothetical protein